MTNQQILEKAIQKAIDGGWAEWNGETPLYRHFGGDWETVAAVIARDYIDQPEHIIFNHDFAKSVFGTEMQNGQPRWRNALQYMVVQEDPIEALARLLEL